MIKQYRPYFEETAKKFNINEEKQVGMLYHFTFPDKIIPILKSGFLKPSRFTDEWGEGISTTRNKYIYLKNTSIAGPLGLIFRFEINGDKVSKNYKIKPVSMFGKRRSQNKILNVPHEIKYTQNEQEERIYGRIEDKNSLGLAGCYRMFCDRRFHG